jgi:putative heme-binding domain-containing protein
MIMNINRLILLSLCLAANLCLAAQPAKVPHVVFLIAEPEYDTKVTVPEFAKTELEPRGLRCTFIHENPKDTNDFPGLEILKEADLLFLSVRRHAPSKAQLALIRGYLAAGKPLVGIRTASHAFGAKPKDDQHEGWETFDAEILGGSYQGHYGAVQAAVKVLPQAAGHPILANLGTNQFFCTSLYKNLTLAGTATPLLTGQVPGQPEIQNVAWVNTNQNRRVFYTSLGAPKDFTNPVFRRLLLNGVFWSLNLAVPAASAAEAPPKKTSSATAPAAPASNRVPAEAPPDSKPLSPAESLARFNIADDLELEQVLAEPIVTQPVFLNFDERGRMWVVQYRQYPSPAGVKLMSHDGFWRAVYDKAPPPPPNHVKGLDKITIHEDTNGDGAFDKHSTFVDGLNIVTALERGRGGVWVLNPPYLLFYPDANHDDVPDGDPIVHLSGFGLEDTHSVANSLRWGPDGWLYASQGSTVTGHIMRPGLDKEPILHTMGQQIWRYHPETRRFEVFSEGGGNAFGVEIDSKGRVFSGHNGGNTRGFHYMQGAYLQKGFEKHGPLSNPYAFGYFPPMPHPNVERFTHNFVIYEGATLPDRYHGKLYGVEPLQGRLVESEITPDQSSFKTIDLRHPVTTSDRWFRPVDIKVGPDGAIFICDWYDGRVNHFRNQEEGLDRSNGRIYRLKAKGAKPGPSFDLDKLPSGQLVEFLGHSNKWFRQTALRVVADRRDKSIVPMLAKLVAEKTGQLSLEALWALHLSGGLSESVALKMLEHPDPFVRLWTVRLLGDESKASSVIADKFVRLAQIETSLETRDQLACSARRLPAKEGLAIVRNLLLHDEDAGDNRLPLLLWWAIESKAETDRDRVLALFEDSPLWDRPLVKRHILERLMRRYAQAGTRPDLLACARLLDVSPSAELSRILMTGFEAAFKGRSMTGLPEQLVNAMARHSTGSLALGLRQGQREAVTKALQTIADEKAKPNTRLEYIGILGEVKTPDSVPVLLQLLDKSRDDALRKAALTALQQYDDAGIGERVVAVYNNLGKEVQAAAQALLSSRAGWSLRLVQAIEAGQVKAESVSLNVVRKMKLFNNEDLRQRAEKIWGRKGSPTSAEMEKQIQHLAGTIRGGIGDPYSGRALFEKSCAACHTLFTQGGKVGPDLSTYQRGDLENMLLSIVNPSAEIREGYENVLIETKDDRSLNGFLVEKDDQVVVLRGLDGQNITLDRKEITVMKAAGISLMPEGLLDSFNPQQVRDLFAYLRSTQPLVGKAP